MAAGSSAPELFSSFLSLVNSTTSGALGVSTIVGSAVFNILVIIGTSAIFANQVLYIEKKAVLRDGIFYAISCMSVILLFQFSDAIYW